jgi:hypothetical protein
MQVLHIKNWEKFQHYKHRRPPWIKLHRSILDDVEFTCLQDASKLHLMMLWILAAQMDNDIPFDEVWLTRKLMLKKQIQLKPLIDSGFLIGASKTLAPCLQSATSESEIRVQSQSTENTKSVPAARFVPPTPQEVSEYAKSKNIDLDGEVFCSFYESNGWKVGRNPMKSWRAAVTGTWSKGLRKQSIAPAGQRKPFPGETLKLLAESRSQKDIYWSRYAVMGPHGVEVMPQEHGAEWDKIKARVKELERMI